MESAAAVSPWSSSRRASATARSPGVGAANDVEDAANDVEAEAENTGPDDQSGDQEGPDDQSEEQGDNGQSGQHD